MLFSRCAQCIFLHLPFSSIHLIKFFGYDNFVQPLEFNTTIQQIKKMNKYLSLFILIFGFSCQQERSTMRDNISIEISSYQDKDQMKASAMPVLKAGSELMNYKRRFDYLLLNIPEIHSPAKFEERDSINKLYPDTLEIKRIYSDKYCQDKKLVQYFEETYAPIKDPGLQRDKIYSSDELMEVASKFFYCDLVRPDTSVQMHVCIGINGLKEAKWETDYTLLAAFCYEAIFNDLESDDSQIRSTYTIEKKVSTEQFRKNITTLDKYLEDVRQDLFNRMKSNSDLKENLLAYYELNKDNLAFKIKK